MKLVLFGAGNIGRSFIGQLFARAGYEVVFVDVNETILAALNAERRYRVIVKRDGRDDETVWIENVRGVDGRDREAVARELAEADIAATAVGQRALPAVLPTLARGLALRRERHGDRPLDIVIAENLHSAADHFRRELAKHLPADFPLERMAGLVETSIGKMVPIMREEDLRRDPLWVFGEAYNTLIVDKHGFRNPIPPIADLRAMDNMKAYVDRKLFIHNLGHAAAAYFGYRAAPGLTYIYEVLALPEVLAATRRAMEQSAAALCREYPADLTPEALSEHVEDLLARFANRALGDTVYRVGRDLSRKLSRADRIVGALLLCKRQGRPADEIAQVFRAALEFRARDERGELFPDDARIVAEDLPRGLGHVLSHVAGLESQDNPVDAAARAEIEGAGR